jgi:hypothetical protein
MVALLSIPADAPAQILPSEPVRLDGGRLVIGGEASVAFAPEDEGYFNYTDYDHNALRRLRLGLSAEWRPVRPISVLADVRTENGDALRPHALYVRVRPWAGRDIDIQAGRIPPVFGSFSQRVYGADNFLIGYPLAYQYLTSLRPDALPASANDLVVMRGRGWLVNFPVGSPVPKHGLPIVNGFRWDTGVQGRIGGNGPVGIAVALTNGTIGNPQVGDDNGGKQVAGRLRLQPTAGLVLGVSGARGAFLSDSVTSTLPAEARSQALVQQSAGLDLEYSRDHWLIRGEAVLSSWRIPSTNTPEIPDPIGAAAWSLEGRYKLGPAWYVAGRLDRLSFSRVTTTRDAVERAEPWEAAVSRVELGGGYYVARNVIMKVAYQRNWREGGRLRTRGFAAAELLYWF